MYMRDTIVFYAIWPRGVISFLKPHIEYFALNNYRVVVVTSSSVSFDELSSLPISIFTCGFSRSLKTLLNPFNYISLYKILNNYRESYIVTLHPVSRFTSSIIAIFTSLRIDVHYITGQFWVGYRKCGIRYHLYRFFDLASCCISKRNLVDSLSQRNFLVSQFKFTRLKPKFDVLSKGSICGVDTNQFFPLTSSQKSTLKQKISPGSPDKFIILFVGRLSVAKGFPLAYQSVFKFAEYTRAQDTIQSIEFWIVGFNQMNFDFPPPTKVVDNLTVTYFGLQPSVHSFMQAADILILPSQREGFGQVVIEAASSGCPTIGSNIPGLQDSIDNGQTGVLIDNQTSLSYSQAILQFAQDKELLAQFSLRSREYALRHFNVNYITKLFFEYVISTPPS